VSLCGDAVSFLHVGDEPAGLNQPYSPRYDTVPVGPRTGRLDDTNVARTPQAPACGVANRVGVERLTAFANAPLDQIIAYDAELYINFHVPGVVLGYAEMLAEYPGLPDSMSELVSEIVSGAKDLAETVDQLRRVTRIRETPRPSLTGSTLNLHESVA